MVVEESPTLAEDLSEKLRFILRTPAKTRAMAEKALKQGKPNASADIIKAIEAFLGEENDCY